MWYMVYVLWDIYLKVADDAVKEKRPLVLHNCSVVLDGYLGKKWRCTSAWGDLQDVPTLCTVNINSGPTLCARCPHCSGLNHISQWYKSDFQELLEKTCIHTSPECVFIHTVILHIYPARKMLWICISECGVSLSYQYIISLSK